MRFSPARLLPLSLPALLALTACTTVPSEAERTRAADRLTQLARNPDRGPPAIPAVATASAAQRAQAFFTLATSGAADAPEQIERLLSADAPAAVVAAAARGLVTSKSPAAERVLLALATHPAREPAAVEALFTFYRGTGAKQAPNTLPHPQLLAFADHPAARGRAAFGHLARIIRDPALVAPLSQLTSDFDFEVRRAAVLGLAEGPAQKTRPAPQRDACLAAILPRFADSDTHVVIAACRAAASYDDPRAVTALTQAMGHSDFNVRVAALEGLGRRKAKSAAPAMARLARTDPSVSVRATAAAQLSVCDPDSARPLVDALLAEPSAYVRAAGAKVLAQSAEAAALNRLVQLAQSDPHVRVREAALEGFQTHTDSAAIQAALRAALADADPVIVATACGVIAKAKLPDFTAELAALPARFPGAEGADAREAAIKALAALDRPAHRALFTALRGDPHPAVRDAAALALAELDQLPPPPPARGADLSGALLPGGAPLFGPEVFLVLETDQGKLRIQLFPDLAPVHCAHVAAFARAGGYNGLTWHRVVPDFVIQGGCPRGDGSGGAGVSLPLEPTQLPFERGTLGMPRSGNPDTGGCQLFLCHSRAPHLDTAYTAFGKVVAGFEVIDRLDVESRILRAHVEGAR